MSWRRTQKKISSGRRLKTRDRHSRVTALIAAAWFQYFTVAFISFFLRIWITKYSTALGFWHMLVKVDTLKTHKMQVEQEPQACSPWSLLFIGSGRILLFRYESMVRNFGTFTSSVSALFSFKVIVTLNFDYVNAAESRSVAGVTIKNPFFLCLLSLVLKCNLFATMHMWIKFWENWFTLAVNKMWLFSFSNYL